MCSYDGHHRSGSAFCGSPGRIAVDGLLSMSSWIQFLDGGGALTMQEPGRMGDGLAILLAHASGGLSCRPLWRMPRRRGRLTQAIARCSREPPCSPIETCEVRDRLDLADLSCSASMYRLGCGRPTHANGSIIRLRRTTRALSWRPGLTGSPPNACSLERTLRAAFQRFRDRSHSPLPPC